MTKTFCDRCEKEIKKPFKKYSIISKLYYRWLFSFWKENEVQVMHELCKDCQESLIKWFENPEKGE